MLQTVYISTAQPKLPQAELRAVLDSSRRNNAAVGVTGLLVAGGRRFLQVLEGPDAAVEATLARIKVDPRHRAIVTLSRKDVDARQFGDWSMGFELGAAAGTADLKSVVDSLVSRLSDRNLAAQFQGFAEIHARAA
ncbi:BLUF domain-containing protein [Sphingosinicella sp. BN140058]|uniref:BLUF domain-containing protein n=1 Tax=Sphingosinicella sp. BN140058 TaxID=1892855 RepID=UPI001011C003|nr:BLUF domain-containing protein [Sphingosinicella sp. BN140058]QAY78375.1 BLUF domain-containing protein [Sphingosinicella sp. BN140058]